MSEDEYKELYLKYKVKYINLKSENNLNNNNNQTGGGLLDYFKKATDEDVERINKEYHEEIRKKIASDIPKLLEIVKTEMYNNEIINDLKAVKTLGQSDVKTIYNKKYLTDLDKINSIINSIINNPKYNDNRIMLDTELNNLILLTNFNTYKDMYYIFNKIYKIIKNIRVIDYDTSTKLKTELDKGNLFKKHLFLTVNQLKLINLILIYGPPNITEAEEHKFIFEELYGSGKSSLTLNINKIMHPTGPKLNQKKYMKLMFNYYLSCIKLPAEQTKIKKLVSDNIINFIDIVFKKDKEKDKEIDEFYNNFRIYLKNIYDIFYLNNEDDSPFFKIIFMKPHVIYESNVDTIKNVKTKLKCFYKNIYNYDDYFEEHDVKLLNSCNN